MKKLLLICSIAVFTAACGGKTAPEQKGQALPALSGESWDFTKVQGKKPVLLAFMSSYCGYCKRMAPLLDTLAGSYKGRDVDFVFVFVDEDADVVKAAVEPLNIANAKVVYGGGDMAQEMHVRAFPQMYLITDGSRGNFSWTGYGEENVKDIGSKINAALN